MDQKLIGKIRCYEKDDRRTLAAILTANGQSTALADQAMASYKAQKSAMYSQLTAKLYS